MLREQETNKKILFVNHCLTGGGSEKAMTLIANFFASQGFNVEMLLLNEQPRTYNPDGRIKVTECYCPVKGNKLFWHFRRIMTIRDAIKKSDASIVISFMWDINMNVILACFGLGKKIITSERCDPRNESRMLMRFAMYFVLPFADITVFQTSVVQKYYPKCVRKRSVVIPNAISNIVPVPDRDPLKIRKEIVGVGRFTEQKNFEMLISAFANVHRNHLDYKLIIYGDGPLRSKYEELILRLGLKDYVSLPGYLKDVNERMRYASIYVNTSNYEGISNAMLEALSMGLPCICTDCPVGGASMVINDGVNGKLIPVGDINSLESKIEELLLDDRVRISIGEEAIKTRDIYSITKIGNRWINLLFMVNR